MFIFHAYLKKVERVTFDFLENRLLWPKCIKFSKHYVINDKFISLELTGVEKVAKSWSKLLGR